MKTNSNYPTIEEQNTILNDLRAGNPKKVYSLLEASRSFTQQGTRTEYSDEAHTIMSIVSKMSEGFVVDICNRFTDASNRFEMSDKQRWCVAYAFCKIQQEIDLYALEMVIE